MVNEFKIKQEICEVGRKLYAKGFAAANDGNISCRVDERTVLCTPTMVSKGFLKPDDICTVDMTGKQIAGRKKRTSEALLHLDRSPGTPVLLVVGDEPLPENLAHLVDERATTYGLARLLKLTYQDAAPSAMIGASNHFEVAIATAVMLFGLPSGAALATVVGVLIEVPVMLMLVKICLKTQSWFGRAEPSAG